LKGFTDTGHSGGRWAGRNDGGRRIGRVICETFCAGAAAAAVVLLVIVIQYRPPPFPLLRHFRAPEMM